MFLHHLENWIRQVRLGAQFQVVTALFGNLLEKRDQKSVANSCGEVRSFLR